MVFSFVICSSCVFGSTDRFVTQCFKKKHPSASKVVCPLRISSCPPCRIFFNINFAGVNLIRKELAEVLVSAKEHRGAGACPEIRATQEVKDARVLS